MTSEERLLLVRIADVVLLIAEEIIDRDQYMKDFSSIDKLRGANNDIKET